ncbi:MAG: GNAT family N-acetyltransferase [Acidobacteria bacterium]|nr:GNAT family N-acetyltransferase [Acidobacteriota bacterium]
MKKLSQPTVMLRDLETVAQLEDAIRLEREVWKFGDSDLTPLTLAVATRAAGSLWIGAYDGPELVGFAFAFPSLERGRTGFHSHTLAVHSRLRDRGIGYELKLEQRKRALALGIKEMTWTFDPLRGRNAHLNFSKLGVISASYREQFYGSETSSPLHRNGTDRLWVTWHMAEPAVEERLKGKQTRAAVLDVLRDAESLVRCQGDGTPLEQNLSQLHKGRRIGIEIPGDIEHIEQEDTALAERWRLATRRAFNEALAAGFVVTEFCRSIRGQPGPGAYLLEQPGHEDDKQPLRQ